MLERLSLRVRILLFFIFLAIGAIGAVALGGALALSRHDIPGLDGAMLQAALFSGILILFLVTGIWYLFDAHVARAIESLANAIRTRVHAEVTEDIQAEKEQAKYLGDLAPAAAAITRSLAETRSALAESVARETSRLSSEKAWMETLLADVPVAVLICTADYELVFYNGQAIPTLEAGAAAGLGRSYLTICAKVRCVTLTNASARATIPMLWPTLCAPPRAADECFWAVCACCGARKTPNAPASC